MRVQSCEVYDVRTDQWTMVSQLTYPANCQPHVVVSHANELMHSNEMAQVLLFGGHSFSNDSDHHWLQRLTLGRDGPWRVEDVVSLSTRGVLYYTATAAKLPVHYLRLFDWIHSALIATWPGIDAVWWYMQLKASQIRVHDYDDPCLHWERSPQCIDFKLAVLVYRCLHGLAPRYLSDYIQSVTDSNRRRLQSSSSSQLVIRRTRLSTVGDRAFPVAGSRLWNSLPLPQLQRWLFFGIASKLSFAPDHFRTVFRF